MGLLGAPPQGFLFRAPTFEHCQQSLSQLSKPKITNFSIYQLTLPSYFCSQHLKTWADPVYIQNFEPTLIVHFLYLHSLGGKSMERVRLETSVEKAARRFSERISEVTMYSFIFSSHLVILLLISKAGIHTFLGE